MIYPSNAERIYYKRLAAYVRKIDVETRKRLIYKTDGFSEDLTAIIQFMLEFSASVMFDIDDIYVMVNEYNDRQFRLVVKKGTGIDLPSSATVTNRSRSALSSNPLDIQRKFGLGVDVYRIEPGLYDLQKNWVANNTQLIKTIPQQYLSRAELIIRQGVMNGKNVKTLTKEIQALGQSTKKRARVIARDQITKANAELTRFRHQELGIKEYKWNTVRDERVRDSHLAHEGKVFSWSKRPVGTGHPGEDVQCLPGSSSIEVPNTVNKLFRRRTFNKLTKIISSGGGFVESTVNHPILTNRGWIPAQEVNVGDYIIKAFDKSFDVSKSYIKNRKPSVADVFNFSAFYIQSERFAATTGQFHDDAILNEEIDIVRFDRCLSFEANALFRQESCELLFTMADKAITIHSFSSLSNFFHCASTLFPAPRSIVSGFCKLLFLLNGQLGHSDVVRLRDASYFNVIFSQAIGYDLPIDVEILSNGGHAVPTFIHGNNIINRNIFSIMRNLSDIWNENSSGADFIGESIGMDSQDLSSLFNTPRFGYKFDRVVKVISGEKPVSSHYVYNLESKNNWYLANNIVTHNCRCFATPVFD